MTAGTKRLMITLLIEDRRNGTDKLVEVHVPLKVAGEGHLWADAKDVCAALQRGPSRIDGALRARAAASEEIKLINFLFRSRQGVHHAWKVSTDVSACFCRWRRDDSVDQLEG